MIVIVKSQDSNLGAFGSIPNPEGGIVAASDVHVFALLFKYIEAPALVVVLFVRRVVACNPLLRFAHSLFRQIDWHNVYFVAQSAYS